MFIQKAHLKTVLGTYIFFFHQHFQNITVIVHSTCDTAQWRFYIYLYQTSNFSRFLSLQCVPGPWASREWHGWRRGGCGWSGGGLPSAGGGGAGGVGGGSAKPGVSGPGTQGRQAPPRPHLFTPAARWASPSPAWLSPITSPRCF